MGYQVAIDGPASSGKSTIAKKLAERLNFTYINTGSMYRSICYYILKNNLELEDENLPRLLKEIDIDLKGDLVYLDGNEISNELRQHNVSNFVSKVASIGYIREILVKKQQEMAKKYDVIMDGRDIGTVVLKDANLKIFMIADVNERAKRRYKENIEKGIETDFNLLVEEIKERDYIDSTRDISPLKKADDAIEVDTTYMSIDQVVEFILSKIDS